MGCENAKAFLDTIDAIDNRTAVVPDHFTHVGERLAELARNELERFLTTDELDAKVAVHVVFERRDGAVRCQFVFKRQRWIHSHSGDWKTLDTWREVEGGGFEVERGR